MSSLFPLAHGQLDGETVQTVNARDLHAFLEVGRDFSNWIKDRIEEYGFIEDQDYLRFSPNLAKTPKGGRPAIDYFLSIDMAKELSMVERTDKGRQARRYFIDCERRAKAAAARRVTAASTSPLPASAVAIHDRLARSGSRLADLAGLLDAVAEALVPYLRSTGLHPSHSAVALALHGFAARSGQAMREAIADLDGLDLAVDTAVRAAMAAPKPISPELREKKRRAVAVRWERERARKAAAGKVAR